MHGAHSQTPSSTSLTHSLIHFPQGKAARAKAWAAFSVARKEGSGTFRPAGGSFPARQGKALEAPCVADAELSPAKRKVVQKRLV